MTPTNGFSGGTRKAGSGSVAVQPAIPLHYAQSMRHRRGINGASRPQRISAPELEIPSPADSSQPTSSSEANEQSLSDTSPSTSVVTDYGKCPELDDVMHMSVVDRPQVADAFRIPHVVENAIFSAQSSMQSKVLDEPKHDEPKNDVPKLKHKNLPGNRISNDATRDGIHLPIESSQKKTAYTDIPNIQQPLHLIQSPQAHLHHDMLQFGAFSDSNHSSPAPNYSGGMALPPRTVLPPPFVVNNQKPVYVPGQGYSQPIMQYGVDSVPSYGLPMLPFQVGGYAAFSNNYASSTPLSFQGSQSPAPTDDTGLHTSHVPLASHYHADSGSIHSDGDYHCVRMSRPPGFHRMQPPAVPPSQLVPAHIGPPDADDLARYIQGHFDNASLSDCVLELRVTNDDKRPVRIHGHQLIFARSPVLREVISRVRSNPGFPPSLPTLLLRTDDKFVKPDAFYVAVQGLYGLLGIPDAAVGVSGTDSTGLPMAGGVSEQLDFALAYAASGHLLLWNPVLFRGLDMIAHLLDWVTIEKILEFVLDGIPSTGTTNATASLKFGEPTQLLINAIIAFIINKFPPNFILDTSVQDPDMYRRVPAVGPSFPQADSRSTVTAIARGTLPCTGRTCRRSNLRHIKFGDLSPTTLDTVMEGGTNVPVAQTQPASHTVLSRVLLNIPFVWLKPALESSGRGNLSGWASAEARHQIIMDVVAEREARRRRALSHVLSDPVHGLKSAKNGLQADHQNDKADTWEILGWVEEAVPYGDEEAPCLYRKWRSILGVVQDSDATAPLYP